MSTKDENGRSTPYNGWLNFETWNIAQYLTSSPEMYERCKRHHTKENCYADVVLELQREGITTTTDGVQLWSSKIDTQALDAMLAELP
jgi:hypothetical protein